MRRSTLTWPRTPSPRAEEVEAAPRATSTTSRPTLRKPSAVGSSVRVWTCPSTSVRRRVTPPSSVAWSSRWTPLFLARRQSRRRQQSGEGRRRRRWHSARWRRAGYWTGRGCSDRPTRRAGQRSRPGSWRSRTTTAATRMTSLTGLGRSSERGRPG